MGELLTLELPDRINSEDLADTFERLAEDIRLGRINASGVGIVIACRDGDVILAGATDEMSTLIFGLTLLTQQMLEEAAN